MVKMNEKIEYMGLWWLPNKPEKQISGILKFDPENGGALNLMGSFKKVEDIRNSTKYEVILGITSEGKYVTLNKCLETKSTLRSSGIHTISFYIDKIFIGFHFEKYEDIKFKNISVRYSNLDEWANVSGFDIKLDGKDTQINYRQPESIKAKIGDDLQVHIDFHTIYPTVSIVQKEATIKQDIYVRVEPLEDKSLDEYLKIVYHIQNFLSLGILEAVHPLSLEGKTEANKKEGNYYPPVYVLYSQLNISNAEKHIHPFQMLFTLKDIRENFETLLNTWFNKIEILEPVYNLYFSTLYNPKMYVEQHFLSLTEALEIFHRRITPNRGKYLSNEEYKDTYQTMTNAIPDSIDKDFKQSLKNKLFYGNEFSLRRRLKELFDKYEQIFKNFVPDKEEFINRVKDSRNYLIHFDSELKEKAATGIELYRLTVKLKILIEICFLSELGFDNGYIDRLISSNRNYQNEIQSS